MQSSGYEVARRAVPTHLCATLRRAALAAAREQQRDAVSWRTALRKLLPRRLGSSGTDAATTPRPVRAPKHRVHVQLPLCADTKALLSAALSPTTGLGDAASRCGLTPSAKLVELSVMIALPGAEAQAPHTDVPPHTPQRMATLWIALQDVNRSLGPTMIYPAAPDELANRIDWAAVQERAVPVQPAITTYGPDGSPDEIPLGLVSPASDNRSCDLPSSVAELGLGSAVAVEMSQGDAMLMDVRTVRLIFSPPFWFLLWLILWPRLTLRLNMNAAAVSLWRGEPVSPCMQQQWRCYGLQCRCITM